LNETLSKRSDLATIEIYELLAQPLRHSSIPIALRDFHRWPHRRSAIELPRNVWNPWAIIGKALKPATDEDVVHRQALTAAWLPAISPLVMTIG
jgi:hypothetical protein